MSHNFEHVLQVHFFYLRLKARIIHCCEELRGAESDLKINSLVMSNCVGHFVKDGQCHLMLQY